MKKLLLSAACFVSSVIANDLPMDIQDSRDPSNFSCVEYSLSEIQKVEIQRIVEKQKNLDRNLLEKANDIFTFSQIFSQEQKDESYAYVCSLLEEKTGIKASSFEEILEAAKQQGFSIFEKLASIGASEKLNIIRNVMMEKGLFPVFYSNDEQNRDVAICALMLKEKKFPLKSFGAGSSFGLRYDITITLDVEKGVITSSLVVKDNDGNVIPVSEDYLVYLNQN